MTKLLTFQQLGHCAHCTLHQGWLHHTASTNPVLLIGQIDRPTCKLLHLLLIP
jgi:hypothetical protein